MKTDEVSALQIIESMPGHAWVTNIGGQITYVSPNTIAYLGKSAADLVMNAVDDFGWLRVVHPNDRDRVTATWRRCFGTSENYDCEHRLQGADGIYRWFRTSARAARDRKGEVAGWYGTAIDIEDQKQAERALRDRELELSHLVNMAPIYLWRLTPEGEPNFYNQRLIDFLGMETASVDKPGISRLSATIEAAVHPDDAVSLRKSLSHSFATGEAFAMRYRLRRADGVYRWVEGRAEPLRDEAGRILQWYGLAHDVDDQMRAGETLRQSERKLQELVDTVPVQIWCVTPEGQPSYINKTMADYIGLHLGDFDAEGGLAAAIQRIVHPQDRQRLQAALRHSFTTGEPFALRFRNMRGDGVFRWTEGHAAPFRDEAGRITQWYGVNVDIEDLLEAQEQLRSSEQLFRQLVETLPAMIDCAAPDGEPIYRSQRLREFLGYDLEELDDKGKSRLDGTLDAGVHPDDVAGVKQNYAHSLATGEPYARKHRLRRYDGEYLWVETRAAAMRNAEGQIVQWNVICLDIDEEVRAREELRLAQESLARATQAATLAELSASIAHEVNQPLAAVVANSHAAQRWLAADPPNIERATKAVDRIIRDANAAADVVSHIRALFRQSMETRQPVAISTVIGNARALMAEEVFRHRVRLEIEIEPDLPALTADPVQLQQVLVNLMRNGIEAMDAVAADRVLRIEARRTGEMVQTSIVDRGPGITTPDKIFDPFFTTKAQGMGMGLAICRSIIEAHGGRLWAESDENAGAVFAFTLPAEVTAAP
jgi:PAS domain S-box-containing protein